jgi:hypothetical protein
MRLKIHENKNVKQKWFQHIKINESVDQSSNKALPLVKFKLANQMLIIVDWYSYLTFSTSGTGFSYPTTL